MHATLQSSVVYFNNTVFNGPTKSLLISVTCDMICDVTRET